MNLHSLSAVGSASRAAVIGLLFIGVIAPTTLAQQGGRNQRARPPQVIRAQRERTSVPQTRQALPVDAIRRIDTLRSQVTTLKDENRRLSEKLALIEDELGKLTGKPVPQDSASVSKIGPPKLDKFEQAFADWAQFQSKVLAAVKPELDPVKTRVEELDGHWHELEIHRHQFGYATVHAILTGEGFKDHLLPFVSPDKVTAEAMKNKKPTTKTTTPPKHD